MLTIGLARLPDIIKTMGHALSDRLMADAAARLRARAVEQLVARATDSQFVVWLPGVGRNDAVAMAFRVRDALGRLSELDREVLLLRHVEGLDNQEIAYLLDLSAKTVSKRHGRALRRLHAALSADGVDRNDL